MLRRIAVVGTGLIGGSVGLAARARSDIEVIGFDSDPESLTAALERGAISSAAASPTAAASGCDVVVLAIPVDLIPGVCDSLTESVAPGTAVTDVGSAKAEVVRRGSRAFGPRFVGGHPMAGSERHGIDAAHPDLFEDAWWILTPTEETSPTAYSAITELVGVVGARPVALAPEVHDSLVARLSHVPQLAASAIVEVAAAAGDRDALLGLAGNGFRDVTRIAASNPDLWVAIVRSNTRSVLEGLSGLGSRLEDVGRIISEGRWDDLRSFLDNARTARLELFAKPVYTGAPVGLELMVPDRPGVLAEVTTAAGNIGANIEDLRIIHSTEGGQGRLELVVAGEDAAAKLTGRLEQLGYRVSRPVD
jgi:prephenate dehydrogenase